MNSFLRRLYQDSVSLHDVSSPVHLLFTPTCLSINEAHYGPSEGDVHARLACICSFHADSLIGNKIRLKGEIIMSFPYENT